MDFEAASVAELMFKLFCFTLDLSFSVCSQVLSFFVSPYCSNSILLSLSLTRMTHLTLFLLSPPSLSVSLSLSLYLFQFTFYLYIIILFSQSNIVRDGSISFNSFSLHQYLCLFCSLSFHHHLLVPDSFFLHLFRYLCAWEETDINKSRPSIGVELRGQVSVFLCFYSISLSLSLSTLHWLLYLFKLRSCMGRLS